MRTKALLCTIVLTACGGASKVSTSNGAGDAGSGGEGGQAGTPKGCELQGTVIPHGTSVEPFGECNVCSCWDGMLSCTLLPCPAAGCSYGGMDYDIGQSFPSTDGCNGCSCEVDGVRCTERDCLTCDMIETLYVDDIESMRTCDPALSVEQCTLLIPFGLECSCYTFTNPAYDGFLDLLLSRAEMYAGDSCGEDVQCEQCVPPTSAFCSAEGRCVDVFGGDPLPEGGAGGVSGAAGAPGP
jgi:hypothetical protein